MKRALTVMMLLILACLSSCGRPKQPTLQPLVVHVPENPYPGTTQRYWVEPMHDTIRVPAGLDPSKTYYRPSHQTIVEIRQERFQPQQFSDEKAATPAPKATLPDANLSGSK